MTDEVLSEDADGNPKKSRNRTKKAVDREHYYEALVDGVMKYWNGGGKGEIVAEAGNTYRKNSIANTTFKR
jgi:hypothetical protein